MPCREEVESFVIVAKPKQDQQTHQNAIRAQIEMTAADVEPSLRVATTLKSVVRETVGVENADSLVEETRIAFVFRQLMVEPPAETIVATVESDDESRRCIM